MTKYNFLVKSILLTLCITLLTMCHFKNENGSKITSTNENKNLIKINIDNLNTEKPILFSSIFNSYKLLPLETSDKCLIGNIDQIEMFNDTLYILDSSIAKALFVFDNCGKFIRKIGTMGKGPGEYIRPSSFTIDDGNRQIQILDSKKIITFKANGKLIGEIMLNSGDFPKYIACLNGITYIDHQIFQGRESDYLLSAIDNTGKILNKWLPFQSYTKGFKQPVSTTNHLIKITNDIRYVKPFMDTIFSINDNTVRPYLVISTQNKITEDNIKEINSIADVRKVSDYYWKCKKFLGVRDYVESPNLTMFRYQNLGSTHSLFYWSGYNKIVCTKYPVIDDLTLTKGYRRFYSTYKNCFISSIDNYGKKLENFIEDVKNKRLSLTKKDFSILEKLTPDSNPVIIFYECREKMNLDGKLAE